MSSTRAPHAAAANPRRRRPGRRRTAVRVGLAIAVLGAAAFALAGIVPGSSGRLAHLSVGWLVLAGLAEAVSLLAYANLFNVVFGPGEAGIGWLRSAQIALGELGAFVVMPTGAGGPILRVWALLASGMELSRLMVRSVVHAVVFNLPYILVALLLGLGVVLGLGPGRAPALVALAPIGVVALAAAGTVAASAYARRHRGERHGRFERLGFEMVSAIPAGVRETQGRLQDPRLLLSSVGYWAGDSGVLILAFHAVHGSAPLGVILLAYLLGQLGNAVPLPGGVGGVEPIMLGVFTASGVPLGLAAAAVVLYRFVSLGLQAAIGSLAAASLAPVLESGSHAVAEQLGARPPRS
ncbi:MAG TPA: lysylphosphatidylglycerol synthase transmembrane domain-containing protein [Solirubrobacteraceae bacterium]